MIPTSSGPRQKYWALSLMPARSCPLSRWISSPPVSTIFSKALSEEALIAQLRGTIETAAQVAESLKDASGGLPAIATQIETLAGKASELPIEDLVASTNNLVKTVDEFAGSEALKDVPQALTDALGEIRSLTAAIQSGDMIANASETFASTQEASAKLTEALDTLPNLIAQMNRVARQAETTLGGVDEDSRFSTSTRETLREIKQAAEAISSLARAIERRPNSLLTGR